MWLNLFEIVCVIVNRYIYMKPQERNYYNTNVRRYDVLIIFNDFFLQHKKKCRGAVITIRTRLMFIIFIIP